jgi:uncharacterized protein with PQ loop repeat
MQYQTGDTKLNHKYNMVCFYLVSTLHRYNHQKAQKTLIVKKVLKPKLIDRLVYLAAIVEPLFSLPQAYLIYHDKAAVSVSILAWLGFESMTLIWLWYGFVHKEKMILIYQGLFFVIDGAVLIGAIYYGGKLY